jgi:hypothetical protein
MNDFYCIFVLKLIMESSKLILYIQIMNKKMFKILLIVILLPMVQSAGQVAVGDGFKPIHNDTFWNTSDGRPLYSQGGGIFRFADPQTGRERYYWYGMRYKGAEEYRNDPTVTVEHAVFSAVTCYSSDNLTDWHYEGDVLTRDEVEKHGSGGWMGRLGVVYIKEKRQYALFVQHSNSDGAGVLIATSDNPTGQFRWAWRKDMTKMIGTPNTGDQTVFTDDDTGRSYLVYSYGRGRNKIYVSEIGIVNDSIDLIDCTQIFRGASREGNCMFKYKGKYYMCASNIYGWDGSYAYYLMADDIRGPYLPTNDMQVMKGCESDYAHVSQTGFFYTLRGTKQETVIYCGDRWADFAGNGLGYNQWVPLSFDGDEPRFNSLSSWSLNAVTGEWRVGSDNNYVLNGSFEADRRSIPNPVKPRQDFLLGWHTTVIKGCRVAVDDSLSPRLNHMNTREDRRHVIGEKSLCISDSLMPFVRRVSQTVASTPTIPLPDGVYTMRARVRRKGRFSRLEMYAVSAGRRQSYKIKPSMTSWTTISIDRVHVSGGSVEIGFWADGVAGAECLVDDVELVQYDASAGLSE